MFEYLAKFNQLPKNLRDQVSNPAVLGIISWLEKKYNLSLAPVVMRVMVKEIRVDKLADFLETEFNLEPVKAEELTHELKSQIFVKVADYLGLAKEALLDNIKPAVSQPPVASSIPPAPPIWNPSVLAKTPFEPLTPPLTVPTTPALTPDDIKIGHDTVTMPVLDRTYYDSKVEVASASVIRQANLKINPDIFNNLQTAVKLYLRGVRSKVDTRALLTKPVSENGLGLTEIDADKFLQIADRAITNLQPKMEAVKTPRVDVMERIKKISHAEVYDLKKVLSERALDTDHELVSGIDLDHEIAPAPAHTFESLEEIASTVPATAPITVPNPIKFSAPITAAKPDLPLPPPPSAPTPVSTPSPVKSTPKPMAAPILEPALKSAPAAGGRSKVEDIRPIRIMDPVDELKYMDLVNFRRLAPSPEERIKKIKNRLQLLEAEDYEKGLAGRAAWRRSPVNKLYLEIIGTSAGQGETFEAVIDGLKKQGADYLTPAEVEAIINLNQSLRF